MIKSKADTFLSAYIILFIVCLPIAIFISIYFDYIKLKYGTTDNMALVSTFLLILIIIEFAFYLINIYAFLRFLIKKQWIIALLPFTLYLSLFFFASGLYTKYVVYILQLGLALYLVNKIKLLTKINSFFSNKKH